MGITYDQATSFPLSPHLFSYRARCKVRVGKCVGQHRTFEGNYMTARTSKKIRPRKEKATA